jgi:hypothetical protein
MLCVLGNSVSWMFQGKVWIFDYQINNNGEQMEYRTRDGGVVAASDRIGKEERLGFKLSRVQALGRIPEKD